LLTDAKTTLGEISEQKAAAIAMVVSMRELTPGEVAGLQKAKAEQADKVRHGEPGKYWAVGTTLRVLFLDGDKKQREIVQRAGEEWVKYANLKLSFVEAGPATPRIKEDEVHGRVRSARPTRHLRQKICWGGAADHFNARFPRQSSSLRSCASISLPGAKSNYV
jgi:hypothetical protein